MLRELMRHIAHGGPSTTESLARELGTSPEMVAAMLEELARRGYVRPVETGCNGACAHCHMATQCATGSPQRVWAWSQEVRPEPS